MMGLLERLKAAGSALLERPTAEAKTLPVKGGIQAMSYPLRGYTTTPTMRELVNSLSEVAWHPAHLNAASVAQCPLKLYRVRGKGDPNFAVKGVSTKALRDLRARAKGIAQRLSNAGELVEVTEHPSLDLLENVSSMLDGFSMMYLTQMSMEVVGRVGWLFDRELAPTSIWPIPGHKLSVEITSQNKVLYRMPNGEPVDDARFLLHRSPDLDDPYIGCWSPMKSVFRSCGLIDLDVKLAWSIMQNRSRPDLAVSPTGEDAVMMDDERKRVEAALNVIYGSGAGGALVSQVPLSIEQIGYTMKEMDQINRVAALTERIYAAFGVPIAFATKNTNLANLQAALTQHGRQAIKPRMTQLAQTMNQQFIWRWDEECFFWFDDPTPDDEASRVKVQQMEAGFKKTCNELRAEDGLEPLAGGDELPKMAAPMPTEREGESKPGKKLGSSDDEDEPARRKAMRRVKQPTSGCVTHNGKRIERACRSVFERQRAWVNRRLVVGKMAGQKAVPTGIDMSGWDAEFAKTAYPAVEWHYEDGIEQTSQRLGFGDELYVPAPKIKEGVESLSLQFAQSTNATTSLQLGDALKKLRGDLLAGAISEANTPSALTRIVKDVFDNASDHRAARIALTESSRATHRGQRLAAKESGVVKGFTWLTSSEPCKFCEAIAARHKKGIGLDEDFGLASSYAESGVKAGGGHYDRVDVCPAHPDCKCTLLEQIDEKMLGADVDEIIDGGAPETTESVPTLPPEVEPEPLPIVTPLASPLPAPTIAEAAARHAAIDKLKQDATKRVEYKKTVFNITKVKGAPADLNQGYNMALNRFADAFPETAKKLEVFGDFDGDFAVMQARGISKKSLASYNDGKRRIYSYMKMDHWKTAKVKAAHRRSRLSGWLVDTGDDVLASDSLMTHELGHALEDIGTRAAGTTAESRMAYTLRNYVRQNRPKKGDLSDYGMTDPEESFAETFAALFLQDPAKRTKWVQTAADKLKDALVEAKHQIPSWL